MQTSVQDYIAAQPAERQKSLPSLHDAILANDKKVQAVVEPMTGKEMIIYKTAK